MKPKWRGIFPALSTVTNEKGELDEEGNRSEVRQNIEWGTHGLCPSIIAGEFYKFSEEERMKVAEIVVDEANGKVPVLVGITHTGTEPAVMLAKRAKDMGADGVIIMPPYFRRMEASLTLYEHFSTIAKRVDIPIMLQDAEDLTGVHMCPTLYARLAKEFSNVVSVKVEGATTLQKIADVKAVLGDKLIIFGGMAAKLFMQELALGAKGNIPDACLTDLLVDVYESYMAGNVEKAQQVFNKYKVWVDFLSLHGNSNIEVEKETLRLRGVIKSSHCRGPNIPMSKADRAELKNLLAKIGLI